MREREQGVSERQGEEGVREFFQKMAEEREKKEKEAKEEREEQKR